MLLSIPELAASQTVSLFFSSGKRKVTKRKPLNPSGGSFRQTRGEREENIPFSFPDLFSSPSPLDPSPSPHHRGRGVIGCAVSNFHHTTGIANRRISA
jgi:hypothetical protein